MSCVNAAQNMKMVVEQKLTTQLGDVALEAYRSGDYELALYRYLQAAFLGDLMAQFNAAFLIERGLGVRGSMVGNEVASALALYRLSSDQGNKRATLEVRRKQDTRRRKMTKSRWKKEENSVACFPSLFCIRQLEMT